ncbi:MAG: hypothetical protein ACE37M_03385 [Henriciella sp.]
MKHFIPALTAALMLTGPALAANDGTLGTSSEGDFLITYTVTNSPNIKISGLENVDLDFSVHDGAPDVKSINLCVYLDQSVPYSVSIKAAPLTDSVNTYPYTYTYSDLHNPNLVPLESTISNTEETKSLSGFLPSNTVDCIANSYSAEFSLVLAQDPTVATTANGATAEIMITVTPG